jgi:hypothetical protein
LPDTPGLEPRSGHVVFVVDKVVLRQVFPCQFSFHRLLHTHRLSSGTGTIGQLVDSVSPHRKKPKQTTTTRRHYALVDTLLISAQDGMVKVTGKGSPTFAAREEVVSETVWLW